MTEKVDVNGPDRHEIYTALVDTPDGSGRTGDIAWNFEKFLIGADGEVLARFDPGVEPEDPALVASVEAQLD
jgi:glutathione peroxidase